MNKKVSLFLLLLGLLALPVASAAADTQPLSLAIGLEDALNLGDPDAMTALFADDGVFINGIGGDEVVGRDAIRDALAVWSRADRSYDIVGLNMMNDELTITVDITDHGVTWGRQTLRATVQEGLLVKLEPVGFRFLF